MKLMACNEYILLQYTTILLGNIIINNTLWQSTAGQRTVLVKKDFLLQYSTKITQPLNTIIHVINYVHNEFGLK